MADSLPDVTMSDALTATWKAIRRRHPKVPDATVSMAPGRGSACGSVAWDAGELIQDGLPFVRLDAVHERVKQLIVEPIGPVPLQNPTQRP